MGCASSRAVDDVNNSKYFLIKKIKTILSVLAKNLKLMLFNYTNFY